ncbi:MAG: hypothetical protein WC971_07070 [Coriobacteriia bacterium]
MREALTLILALLFAAVVALQVSSARAARQAGADPARWISALRWVNVTLLLVAAALVVWGATR